jgi:hypothetical protein
MIMPEYCFSALALGAAYRKLAVNLATNLKDKAPGVNLILATDAPQELEGISNIIAIRHSHRFGYLPYNDKVFALEEALKRYPIAIQTDVDLTFTTDISAQLEVSWLPGITARSEPLLAHTERYNSADLNRIKKLAQKLDIAIEKAFWVGEHLFVVRADGEKEKEFLNTWKKLAGYWDIHKLGAKDGTPIGLAAASVGWSIQDNYWQELDNRLVHLDFHRQLRESEWSLQRRQWDYRLRILRSRFDAIYS